MENEISKAIKTGFENLIATVCVLTAITLFATGNGGGGFAVIIFIILLVNSSKEKTEEKKAVDSVGP